MIGVDEVGRGCLAGPLLVVAARQKGPLPKTVKDSKLLTRATRERLSEVLVGVCDFGEGWVSAAEIDKAGLANALRLGVKRALSHLEAPVLEEIIMDGKVNYIPKKYTASSTLVAADNLLPIVSAASIYAKVIRDRFMIKLAKNHVGYGFENHVGYFTTEHKLALKKLGPIVNVHRMSFQPLKVVG